MFLVVEANQVDSCSQGITIQRGTIVSRNSGSGRKGNRKNAPGRGTDRQAKTTPGLARGLEGMHSS